LGAHRDQILNFHVGGHEPDFVEFEYPPDYGHLFGNLYTSGVDMGASYALKDKYGPPNVLGQPDIPVPVRTREEAERDHQLAMLYNAEEAVNKRDALVTEDFHGKI